MFFIVAGDKNMLESERNYEEKSHFNFVLYLDTYGSGFRT